MDHFPDVRGLERNGQLADNLDHLALRLRLTGIVRKQPALEEPHRQVVDAVLNSRIVDRTQVGVVQLGRRLRLAEKALRATAGRRRR